MRISWGERQRQTPRSDQRRGMNVGSGHSVGSTASPTSLPVFTWRLPLFLLLRTNHIKNKRTELSCTALEPRLWSDSASEKIWDLKMWTVRHLLNTALAITTPSTGAVLMSHCLWHSVDTGEHRITFHWKCFNCDVETVQKCIILHIITKLHFLKIQIFAGKLVTWIMESTA